MLATNTCVFLNSHDPELDVMSGIGSAIVVNKNFILVKHEPQDINAVPVVEINGIEVTLGAPNSGADYEIKRVSTTQTIVRRKVADPNFDALVRFSPPSSGLPIGQGVIGSTFKIG